MKQLDQYGCDQEDYEFLNSCVSRLYKITRKYRMGFHFKEKYGTLRFEYSPYSYWHPLHSLLYPGYYFIQYKYKWMIKLDRKLNFLFTPICEWLYKKWCKEVNKLFWKFIAERPDMAYEILDEYDDYSIAHEYIDKGLVTLRKAAMPRQSIEDLP